MRALRHELLVLLRRQELVELARVLGVAWNVGHGSSYLPSEPLRRAPGLDGRRSVAPGCSALPSEPLRRAPGLDGRRSVAPGCSALPSEPLRRAPGLDGRRSVARFIVLPGMDGRASSRRGRA